MPKSDYEFFVVLLNRAAKDETHLQQDTETLHRAFYELKEKYAQHFPQLANLHFITAGAFPYSPDLTDALDVLQFSGASSKENPSFERFSPKEFAGLDEWLDEASHRLTGEDEARTEVLNRVTDELSESLRTTQRART